MYQGGNFDGLGGDSKFSLSHLETAYHNKIYWTSYYDPLPNFLYRTDLAGAKLA